MSSPEPNAIEADTLFTWTIKNFEMCSQKTFECITSPEFSPFARQIPRYQIVLYPRGVDKDSANHLSVCFNTVTSSEDVCDRVYSCEIGIMTSSGKQSLFELESPRKHFMWLKTFLDRSSLSSADNEHSALVNGNLTLYCAITDEGSADSQLMESPNSSSWSISSSNSDEELLKLSEAFEKAYKEEVLTDMELQTKGKAFRVHRALIEARFPILAKMQDSGLANMEEKTADALLRYIYTGRLKKKDFVDSPDLFFHIKSFLGVRSQNIEAQTIISRKSVSFTWNVENFCFLTSDDFQTYSMFDADIQNCLNITLTVSSNDPSDDDLVLFSVTRYSQECKRVICKISALDRCSTFEHTFDEEDCWKIPAFAQRGEVVEKGSDVASFLFEVSLTDGKCTSCVNSIQLSPYSSSSLGAIDDLESFRNDLRTMFYNCTHKDVSLISLPDTKFEMSYPCHRFVLAARSDGFRKIFENCETPHQVLIDDLTPNVVTPFLLYLYTGGIADLPELKYTIDLYVLAKTYDIPSLRKQSMRRIKSELSADTLVTVLEAAYEYCDSELRGLAFDFMFTYPRLVLNSPRLQEDLEYKTYLASDILDAVLRYLAGENNGSEEIEDSD